jgi:probable HAF family extracellular repeat protein
MKWKISAVFIATCVFGVLTPIQSTAQGPEDHPRYNVQDLGVLGGTFSSAFGINNLGWVTGATNLEGDQTEHPVLWRNGSIIDLGTLGAENGSAGFPLKNNLGLVPAFAQTSEMDPLGENWNFTCSLSGNLAREPISFNTGSYGLMGGKYRCPRLAAITVRRGERTIGAKS